MHVRNPRNIEEEYVLLSVGDHQTNRRPNTGEPGSTWQSPNGDKRTYGPDGTPALDYDHNDHGQADKHPHDEDGGHYHDWKNGKRGPAYVPTAEIALGVVLVVGCGVGLAFVAINNVTGAGVLDDTFLVPLGEGFKKGMSLLGV